MVGYGLREMKSVCFWENGKSNKEDRQRENQESVGLYRWFIALMFEFSFNTEFGVNHWWWSVRSKLTKR